MIIAIMAHDEDWVIGKGNELPWRLPEDLKLFKKHTTGHVVVMGRKTWESIPEKYRPLPNRINVILSTTMESNLSPAEGEPWVVNNWEQVPGLMDDAGYSDKDIFVIGGASIYDHVINKSLIPADRILLSLVKGIHEGDVFFPELKGSWADVHVSEHDGFDLIEKIRYETCIPVDGR